MFDINRRNREVIKEFILIYKREECLWKMKSKHYQNRAMKTAAYKKLLKKLKEIEPKASKNRVLKKINTLRTTYRQEQRIVEASKRSGLSRDGYLPNLWYFDLMSFIDEQKAPRTLHPNLTGDGEENVKTPSDTEMDSFSSTSDDTSTPLSSPTSSTSTQLSTSSSPRKILSNRSSTDSNTFNDVLITLQNHFKQPTVQEDRFDLFTKVVVFKMRELTTTQALIAEKIINETLFEAELGNLTLSHKLCKTSEQYF